MTLKPLSTEEHAAYDQIKAKKEAAERDLERRQVKQVKIFSDQSELLAHPPSNDLPTWKKLDYVALAFIAVIGLASIMMSVAFHFTGMAPLLVYGAGGLGVLIILVDVALIGVILTRSHKANSVVCTRRDLVKGRFSFQAIESGKLLTFKNITEPLNRKYFQDHPENFSFPPPIIAKSAFVPRAMVGHLMRYKADRAIAVKHVKGGLITNMEGAMHTFVTPVVPILVGGDDTWRGSAALSKAPFLPGQARQVVMSAAVQPDFENEEVMLELIGLGDQPVIGVDDTFKQADLQIDRNDPEQRAEYDARLKKHMIYHLMSNHNLPAKDDEERKVLNGADCEEYVRNVISRKRVAVTSLKDHYVQLEYKGTVRLISLEALYAIYYEQVTNELRALERLDVIKKGYVLTIDPPNIFAAVFGKNAGIMNALQALALRDVLKNPLEKYPKLKAIAFNNYKGSIQYFELALKGLDILLGDKQALYDGKTHCLVAFNKPNNDGSERSTTTFSKSWTLVVHNNSDAFGQNIETEGYSSLDGVLGSISSAAESLKRTRPDLVNTIVDSV